MTWMTCRVQASQGVFGKVIIVWCIPPPPLPVFGNSPSRKIGRVVFVSF